MTPLRIIVVALASVFWIIGLAWAGPIDEAIEVAKKKDFSKAIELLQPLAKGNDQHAQFLLGLVYENRGASPKDFEAAVEWYRKAAERGDVAGIVNLGDMLRWGKGVERSDAEAVIWYRKAASIRYAAGQRGLGIMLSEGRGVPSPNISEAVEQFRMAADQGDKESATRLNEMILTRSGTSEDADARYSPALCYLWSKQTLVIINASKVAAAKSPNGLNRSRPPVGCNLFLEWANKGWRRARDVIAAMIKIHTDEILSAGYEQLPKNLEVTIVGRDEVCPKPTGKSSKPSLTQKGFDLQITGFGKNPRVGAIVGNRIVVVLTINLTDQYSHVENSISVVYGQWTDGKAKLSNTLGTCEISIHGQQ